MRSKALRLCSIFLCIFYSTAYADSDLSTVLQNEMQVLKQTVFDLKLLLNEQSKIIQSQGEQIQQLSLQRFEQWNTVDSSVEGVRSNKGWVPEIGVIADMVAKFDSPKVDEEGADRLSVREVELVFGSAVDPYSRFDSTIAFSDFENPSLEEAYLTHFALPWELTGRFGKMKPKVGKILTLHRDSIDTVDLPLVVAKYFGVEGYNKAGADFTRGFDWNWPLPQEVTFGILEGGNGEEGSLFGASRRRPTIYSHFETYLDLNESTGFEFGFSHLAGSKDADPSLETQVIGLDTTLIHHFNPNQHLKLQSEAFFVHRQETNLDPDESSDLRVNDSPWGIYGLLDFRFAPQWATGFRYDFVELIDSTIGSPDDSEEGFTTYLTFYQSEYARWRAQFSHFDRTDGTDDNQVLLQGTFAIGEHKHKIN